MVTLVGALLLEQNDEWAVQCAGYMTLETIAPMGEDVAISLPAAAIPARPARICPIQGKAAAGGTVNLRIARR